MQRTIIYIHGFGSSGARGKAELFREHYKSKGVAFLAPSLSYVPELAVQTLQEIACNCKNPVFIGSSLGGFYALFLANQLETKAVLINPALYAPNTLKRHVQGFAINYFDLSKFEWNDRHLAMLKRFKVEAPKQENIFLLLQKGDDVLDYKESLKMLSGAKCIVEEGGTHRFEGIERYFKEIDHFLGA